MKKAIVLGASGNIGKEIVKDLVKRNIPVIAFARNDQKLKKLFAEENLVEIVEGDVFQLDDLDDAMKGVDVIFHAVNLPYPEWHKKLSLMMKNILQMAKRHHAKLAMVDNIYAYGKSNGKSITETFPKNPITKKGKIRLQLEEMIKQSGIPYLIVHFPDFYGPGADGTLLDYFLQSVIQNKTAMFVGDQKKKREYIFTPDGAKAIVTLALSEDAYGQNCNVPASNVISGEELVQIVRDHTGYDKKVKTVTKGMVRLLGIFDKMMREYKEMFYLNQEPVVLSGEKYQQKIGRIPATPYREGIRQTLAYMQQNKGKGE